MMYSLVHYNISGWKQEQGRLLSTRNAEYCGRRRSQVGLRSNENAGGHNNNLPLRLEQGSAVGPKTKAPPSRLGLARNGKSFAQVFRSVLADNCCSAACTAATYCKESRMRTTLMRTIMHKRFPISVLGFVLIPLVSGRIDNSSWPTSGMSHYEISVRTTSHS
ncbi:uncharacterized protein HD556DRAFT_913197 [Suillus plorans]|uniref:Uncharacterized protein n=1 Tax=Suillus plorans TaxID=116603 RepID=A0A9P7DCS7_9AGAM|nr:uncharacterized protein HD556DRAFT_913197 [Suillus plorans]KAG1788110.1 hypothetical protein HD556DRAFT_913197 [Suillus plorans]